MGLCIIFSCVLLHRASCIDGWWREIVVAGPSMAPTLWGPTHQFSCTACGLPNRYHGRSARIHAPCWHCGVAQTPSSPRAVPADRVTIDRAAYRWQLCGIPLTQAAPQRGDWVAVLVADQLRVKRVLGVPGDRVAVRGGELLRGGELALGGELLINDRPVRESLPGPIPTCLVHSATLSSRREFPATAEPTARHRWQAIATEGTVSADNRQGSPANWWVYHHFSVHDRRSDCVRDDYACNVDVRRALHPVDRLVVRLEVDFRSATTLDVWFWHPAGSRHVRRHCLAGQQSIRLISSDATTSRQSPAVTVDARRPVAVAGLPSTGAAEPKITIERELYWFVEAADRQRWPSASTELAADRYFIAGDNQAISVDSRSDPAGVHRDQIIGKVKRRW